jgi:hypothetical protein
VHIPRRQSWVQSGLPSRLRCEHGCPEFTVRQPWGSMDHVVTARTYECQVLEGADSRPKRVQRHDVAALDSASGAGLQDLMARMRHDSERAALIYQHEARGADAAIANAIDAAPRRCRCLVPRAGPWLCGRWVTLPTLFVPESA